MAKVYLDSGDNFTLSSAASVFGSTGTEKLIVNSGVTGAVFDANVERIDLPGASSAYTYLQAGNTLRVYSGTTLVATTTVQDDADGSQVVFSNGSVSVKVSASGMTLGGATVSSTTAGAVNPTTMDTATTSGSGSGGTSAGQSFTLTQGADNKVGTSADETFQAYVDNGVSSYQYNLDTIDGGTGTDTLVAYGQSVGTTAVSLANVTNVEQFQFRATGASNFNMGSTSGYTQLKNDGSSAALTFSGIATTTPTLEVNGATDDTSFLYAAAALAGSSDSVTIKVNGYNASTKSLFLTDAIETLTVNSTGAASNFILQETGSANLDVTTTLNVTGSANLTVTGDKLQAVKTLSASTFTGGLSVDLTSNAVATGTSVTGGNGNDTVIITGTSLSKATGAADSINLGGGTGDVLAVAATTSAAEYATFLAAANSVVSNTEGVRFDSATVGSSNDNAVLAADGFTNGVVNFIFNTANAHATTASVSGTATIGVTGLVSANTLTFNENTTGNGETTTGDIAVSITGASAGQVANIALGGATILGGVGAAATADGGAAFYIGSGVSSVVLTSNSDAALNTNTITGGSTGGNGNTGNDSYAFSSTNLSSVTLKGATNITIQGGSGDTGGTYLKAGFSAGVNLNAADYTGAATVYLANDSTTGDIFTGGSGADTAYGLGGADNLVGNAGNDTLYGGLGKDTLSGGDGDDTLYTGEADTSDYADQLTGGNGTDKFYFQDAAAANGNSAANITAALRTITDFNASGEKIYLARHATTTATLGTEFFTNTTTSLTDMAWNATTGITATEGKFINLGTLATDVGSTTVAGDLLAITASSATAGKIYMAAAGAATSSAYTVAFNSARDGATYVAVVVEEGTAAGIAAADSVSMIKLTGVAVADLAAVDFTTF